MGGGQSLIVLTPKSLRIGLSDNTTALVPSLIMSLSLPSTFYSFSVASCLPTDTMFKYGGKLRGSRLYRLQTAQAA